jgi:hypothetical protein
MNNEIISTNTNLKIETHKYPYVIFYRHEKYSHIDNYLLSNKIKGKH